jgi:hypothetical protein
LTTGFYKTLLVISMSSHIKTGPQQVVDVVHWLQVPLSILRFRASGDGSDGADKIEMTLSQGRSQAVVSDIAREAMFHTNTAKVITQLMFESQIF